MPYKVTFYGDRKPEIVPDDRGQMMYQDFQTGEMPDRVEVRAGLTVERRTIREIERVKGESNPRLEEMSRAALDQFERDKLAPFLTDGELTYDGKWRFLESESVVRVERLHEPVRYDGDVVPYIQQGMEARYQDLTNKIRQWSHWRGKRTYAKKMQEKEYDAIAKTM